MSQSLPIPAQRWLSLLLCAITAAAITVFLSNVSFVRQAYASWGSILYANSVLHYSFAFLSGIGIKLMLDKFYISHAKRSIGFNWRYPPVTISVLFGLLFIVGYVYFTYSNEIVEQLTAHAFLSFKFLSLSFLAVAATIIYQTKLYTKNPIFSVVLCSVSAFYLFSAINLVEIEHAFCVFFFIAAAYLGMSIYLLSEQLRVSNKELIVESKQKVEFKFESLEHFQKWFKDDLPVQSTTELEPDLQVYAQRITERLLTGGDKEGYERKGAQHIALCGPFGCGKSSIVAAIANELKKPKKIEAGLSDEEKLKVEQQIKINWIYSDISTWGAASGSVAHVILSNIIDDISQHIDMCAFRALPKHYTEALKSGGSFFQFASTLLAGPIDIEESFKKLNDVLEVTNHKLLITLQDVDRGTGDENGKRLNDIAALLDRLKDRKLSNINFIVAMGNENDIAAEVISKATDYREDILLPDLTDILRNLIELSMVEATTKGNIQFLVEKTDSLPKKSAITESFDSNLSIFIARNEVDLKRVFSSSSFFNDEISALISILSSIRQVKKVLRRVSQVWERNSFRGEVSFNSLILVCALRECNLSYYQGLILKYDSFLKENNRTTAYFCDIEDEIYSNFFRVLLRGPLSDEDSYRSQKPMGKDAPLINSLNQIANNLKPQKKDYSCNIEFRKLQNFTQSLGCLDGSVNYLKRITLESIPSNELSEQSVFKEFMGKIDFDELAFKLCNDIKFQHVVSRFDRVLFQGTDSICSLECTNTLFLIVLESVKKTHYTNYSLFKDILSQIFIRTISVNNFPAYYSKLLDVISVNQDWNLLIYIISDLDKKYDLYRSLEQVLDSIDFTALATDTLESGGGLATLKQISILQQRVTKNSVSEIDYDFILQLLIKRSQNVIYLKVLAKFILETLKEKPSILNSLLKKLSVDEISCLISRLTELRANGISDEDIKRMNNYLNNLKVKL